LALTLESERHLLVREKGASGYKLTIS